MKKLIILFVILAGITNANGQCTANYSYSGAADTLTFTNISIVSNAHYYWHFGDGSGSNDINPVHIFPDDGDYIVTLYVHDTLNNCSDAHETLINVVKPDTVSCNLLLDAHMQGVTIITSNLSTNCSGFGINCGAGPGANYCSGVWSDPLWGASLWLAWLRAYTNDSIYNYRIWKEYYNTVPYQFTSDTNYQNCSSNFEIIIDYQSNGALVTLTSMNQSGNDIFSLYGFGNTIDLPGPTASYLYPYYGKNLSWVISYEKSDPAHNCPSVRGTQNVLIRNPYYTFPPNCAISLQPQTQTVVTGSSVQFIISTPNNVTKQWQEDAGLGYMNLSNAGPYSGVNTDTLTITNVQLTMNNYNYRCIVADSSGFGCHNTSSAAVLNVNLTGIDEIEMQNIKIHPNPSSDYLTFSLPENLSIAEIKIFNLLGNLEFSSMLIKENTNIDISALTNGIHILEITSGKNISRGKFIKQQNIR